MHLERIKTGQFGIEKAIDIENISEDSIIGIEELFDNKIILDSSLEKRLLNGMNIDTDYDDGIYNIYLDERYYGLGEVKGKKLKRFIIL